MDAGGRPGLVWWWWLRQGPRRRRAGAQEQQQSGLAGLESRVRRAAYLRRGPEVQSPMKDKPTTQRPPAGLRIDYPVPPGSGEALARAGARAGPTYAPIQCKSQSTTRLLLLLLLLLGGDRAAAAVARSSRLGPTLNRPKDSARLVGSASNSARARGQERHHQTSQWGKLTACSKEKLSSPLAAAGEEPTGRCELERLVQSTRHLGKSSGGAGGGRGACAAAHCGRRRSGGSAHALSPHPLPTPLSQVGVGDPPNSDLAALQVGLGPRPKSDLAAMQVGLGLALKSESGLGRVEELVRSPFTRAHNVSVQACPRLWRHAHLQSASGGSEPWRPKTRCLPAGADGCLRTQLRSRCNG